MTSKRASRHLCDASQPTFSAERMTTPYERARAVLQTRVFLQELCSEDSASRLPADVRHSAERLLRHYPGSGDVAVIAELLPSTFALARDPPPIESERRYWRRMLSRALLFSVAFSGMLCGWVWLAVHFGHH